MRAPLILVLSLIACAPSVPRVEAPVPMAMPSATQPGAMVAAIPDSLTLARRYTTWFYNAQFDSLVAHHPEGDRHDPAIRRQLEERLTQLSARAGSEVEVIEEKFVRRGGSSQYWRTARFTNLGEPILLRWVINPQGEITGIGLGPLSRAPPIDPPTR